MDNRISNMKWGIDGTGELEFNKQALVEASANLYRWIMETEERAMVEVLALNSGNDALLRLRKVIDEALEMAAKVESGTVDPQQSNGAEPAEICPHCGGHGIKKCEGMNRQCEYCERWW